MQKDNKAIAWTELYDPKEGRAIRQIPFSGTCPKCRKWNGHALDCPEVDMEQLAKLVYYAQKQEENAKSVAKRYWEYLQRATGKVATLKLENQKLRQENQKLRQENKKLKQEKQPDYVAAIELLKEKWEGLQQSRRLVAVEHVEDTAWMNGFSNAIGILSTEANKE